MLHLDIKKCEHTGFSTASTRKVTLGNLEGIIQIDFGYKNMVELLQNTIIDLLVSHIHEDGNTYNDFSLMLEKINKDIKHIRKDYDLKWLKIFLGIVDRDMVHFSILWDYHVYLIKSEKIIDIADGMQGSDGDFWYISSGSISSEDNVFISTINLLDYLTKDDIFELSSITDREKKSEIIGNLLGQELKNTDCHVLVITNPVEKKLSSQSKTFDYIIDLKKKITTWKEKLLESDIYKKTVEYIGSKVNLENKYIRGSLLGTGLLICIILLYAIISGLVNTQIEKTVPEEYKTKLIEAKVYIEKAGKDIGNKDAFEKNIKLAETILFDLREQDQEYLLQDRKKILDNITILKKQFNGIESFELWTQNAEYVFQKADFWLGHIFEISKKLYFIGKNSLISGYVKGWEVKTYNYPDGEELLKAEATNEGQIFILTKSFRILKFYKGEFAYVNVEGQKTWENAKNIKLYNGSLYLLAPQWNQIFKHKPGINGFASRSAIFDESETKNLSILDFAIDGGFYLLKNDLTLDKAFTTPSFSKRSIVLNKLPDNYKLEDNIIPTVITGQNLNYLYMLINGKLFIFEPDARNYKDVRSAKYIGQLEPANTKILSVFVPKDGEIYFWDNKWIYSVHYEISDGKIVVR